MEISWENIDELEDYQITYLLYKESLNVNQIAKVRNLSPQDIADHLIKIQVEKREEDRKKDTLELYLTLNKEERLEYLEQLDSDELTYFKRKILRLIPIEKDIRNLMILAWTVGEIGDAEFLDFLEGLSNHENGDMKKVANIAIKKIKNKSKEEYGISRLENFIKNNYKNNQEVIIEKLKSELKEFSNKDNYDDDILIVMLKNN